MSGSRTRTKSTAASSSASASTGRSQARASRPVEGITETSESAQPITIKVGELGSNLRTVTGISGMTVGQALEQAGVRIKGRQTLIRGQSVHAETVLSEGDVLVVSGNVRGGTI